VYPPCGEKIPGTYSWGGGPYPPMLGGVEGTPFTLGGLKISEDLKPHKGCREKLNVESASSVTQIPALGLTK